MDGLSDEALERRLAQIRLVLAQREPDTSSVGLELTPDGTIYWLKDDRLHRDFGPAVEYADGGREWWYEDQRHRLDGPAVEYADGTYEWWYEDVEYSHAEWLRAVLEVFVDSPEEWNLLRRLSYTWQGQPFEVGDIEGALLPGSLLAGAGDAGGRTGSSTIPDSSQRHIPSADLSPLCLRLHTMLVPDNQRPQSGAWLCRWAFCQWV